MCEMGKMRAGFKNKVVAVALSASLVFSFIPASAWGEAFAGLSSANGATQPGASDAASAAVDDAGNTELPADLTTLGLVEAEEISNEEMAALTSSSIAAAPSSQGGGDAGFSLQSDDPAAVPPSEADGSKIERIAVEWITQDSVEDGDDGTLSLAPSGDQDFSVRMRLNVALSGQYDYNAGDIQISIPKSIFEDRAGAATGNMTLSVPEAPDARATFMYTDMGDHYVLANTRKLSAATSAMFEFTIKDLAPCEIVDGVAEDNAPGSTSRYEPYTSSPFEGTVQVTTSEGNIIEMASGRIDCIIDTSEKVTSAYMSAGPIYESWPSSWPAALKPADPENYIYTYWYTYCTISGNQYFNMAVAENAHTDQCAGTLILGYKDASKGTIYTPTEGSAEELYATLLEDGYEHDGVNFSARVYLAYPKANFEDNNIYRLKNSITYTLTDSDDLTVSTASDTAEVVYAPVSFSSPAGSYGIEKTGSGSSVRYIEGDREGIYGYALSQLRNGIDTSLSYRIDVKGFTMPQTRADGADPEQLESYNEKAVTLVVTDDETHFDFDAADLTARDFEFKSVYISKPTMLQYRKFEDSMQGYLGNTLYSTYISAGTYAYTRDDDVSHIPAIEVYGKTEAGEWTHYATTDWTGGSAVTATYNGASASGSTVYFPQGVTDYKTELSTKRDGIFYSLYPTLSLKATEEVKAQVEELFDESDTPTTKVSNKATLSALDENGTSFLEMSSTGRDKLDGASMAVWQTKSATYRNDTALQQVKIHYSSSVYEQTNLSDLESYNEAIAVGAITRETSGTFYDLLPLGVVPDLGSIQLRSGDTITGIEMIENYKDTGRTLLKVSADLCPAASYRNDDTAPFSGYCDAPTIEFDATYTWSSMADYGRDVNNVIAFESGNDQIGTMAGYSGEPDNPMAGNNIYSKDAVKGVEDAMTDLNPSRDANSFVYANCETDLAVDTSTTVSLDKDVSVNNDNYYDEGLAEDYPRNVSEGGSYTYRLRIQNDSDTKSDSIVFYDALESFVPGASAEKTGEEDKDDVRWKGKLVWVDVSQLTTKGIDAKVYYSTASGLVLDDTSDRSDLDLSNETIWSTTCPEDKSTITAVAIDASKKTDGTDFLLGNDESIAVELHMKAPVVADFMTEGTSEQDYYDTALGAGQTEAGLVGGAHAYNNVSMLSRTQGATGSWSEVQLDRKDYTKVGLTPFSLTSDKTWDDNDDQDGKRPESVVLHLVGNGTDTGKSVTLPGADNGDGTCTYIVTGIAAAGAQSAVTQTSDSVWHFNWTDAFGDVNPTTEAGATVSYTFTETGAPDYSLQMRQSTDGEGSLSYALTNVHIPEKIEISATKTWDDDDNAAGERPESIKLKLYADGEYVSTKTVTADASGNWKYSFTNLDKYKAGCLIDYTVEEEYVPKYVTAYAADGSVTNTYHPYGNLVIGKTIENATAKAADTDFVFTVALTDEDGSVDTGEYAYTTSDGREGTVSSGGSITLKGGQTATIANLPSEDTYRVTEAEADGFYTSAVSNASGTIFPGETATASFANTYITTGSVQLKAAKTLTGRTLAAKQFAFQVLDGEGNVLRTASCAADGSVAFGIVKYGNADDGRTYTYYIREKVPDAAKNADGVTWADATEAQKDAGGFSQNGYTYDSAKRMVRVAVADKGDGTMAVTPTYYDATGAEAQSVAVANTYHAAGEATLSLWKTLKARELKAGEFAFGLYAEDGTTPVTDGDGNAITATNAADGTVTFPALSYDETHVGRTFTYVAKEIVPAVTDPGYDPTVVYDTTAWKYTVTVCDDGDGTLSFDLKTVDEDGNEGTLPVVANTLNSGSLTITKAVESGDPSQEFKFTVKLTSPTGESLDGEYSFSREEATFQTVDIATVDDKGNALPGATYTVYKNDESGNTVVVGTYTADDNGKVSVRGLGEGYTYTARITGVPEGYSMPETTDIALTQTDAIWSATVTVEDEASIQAYAHIDGDTSNPGYFTDIADESAVASSTELSFAEAPSPSALIAARLASIASTWVACAEGSGDAALDATGEPVDAQSADTASVEDNASLAAEGDIASGTKGNCTWVIDASGLLTVSPNAGTDGKLDVNATSGSNWPWYGNKAKIKGVKVMSGVVLTNSANWMFYGCSNVTTVDLSGLDASNVTSMANMFNGCSKLASLDLSGFDTSNVTNMGSMFYGCSSLASLDLSGFDTSKVEDMGGMLYRCSSLASLDLSGFDTSKVEDMSSMFNRCSSLASLDLSGLDASNVTSMNSMFYGCSSLASLDLSGFDTSKVKDMFNMFYGCSKLASPDLSKFDTSNVTYMGGMFQNCSSLASLDLSGFDTSNVTGMGSMFNGCSKLASLDLSGFSTPNVTSMGSMFNGCSLLASLDLSRFDTSKVTNMSGMFNGCKSLASLDLSGFSTSNVETMGSMFYGCSKLASLDLSKFDTSKVTYMANMFQNCSSLASLDLSKFDTSNVTGMFNMFNGCRSLASLDLSKFDTSNVKTMANMFSGCTSLKQVTMGENFSFKGGGTSVQTTLPSPTGTAYTGKWVIEDKSVPSLTASELASAYPNAATSPAGTWVWEEKAPYTVSFKANGGKGSMADLTCKANTSYTLPANTFYLLGKKFTGWNTLVDGTGTAYADGAAVKDLAEPGGTATLYAQWESEAPGVVTDGKMELALHGNESLTIANLPAGTQYQVYEETPTGWVLVQERGASGVIEPLVTAEAVFVNDYQPNKAQAAIVGTKTVDGSAGKVDAGAYSFQLKDSGGMLLQTAACSAGGSIVFDPVVYESAGTYAYTVSEVVPDDAVNAGGVKWADATAEQRAAGGFMKDNIAYDSHTESVTVTVADDGAGKLSASVAYDDTGVAFDNSDKTPTQGTLRIAKAVEGTAAADKDFTFTVETICNGVRATETVTAKAGETVEVGLFDAGTTYTVTEENLPAGYTLESSADAAGTIVAGATSTALFTNTYSAVGSATLRATKTFEGGTLAAGTFSFVLKEGDTELQTMTCDADGSVAFEPISYTTAGTHTYAISEVVPASTDTTYDPAVNYDAHTENVTVVATDKGDGTIAAAVTYASGGTAAVFANSMKTGGIKLEKTATGGTSATANREFSFTLNLTGANGAALTGAYNYERSDGQTGTVSNGGTVCLKADQSVTVKDIPAGTAYSLVEDVPAGYVQKSSQGLSGSVSAGETVSAQVTNAYSCVGTWTPDIKKVLTGGAMEAGQFTFMLFDAEGNVLQTAANDENGTVVFQPISYDAAADGQTFAYTVSEVNDKQDDYTYDAHVATVSVAVADNGDGTMTVTPSYGSDKTNTNTFTNGWSLEMPFTGRAGTVALSLGGAVLVAAAVVSLVRRKGREPGSR